MCQPTKSSSSSRGTAGSTEQQQEILHKVAQFIDGGSRQPASKPGFAHAIKTSTHTIDQSRLSLGNEKNTLIYRYRFGEHVSKPTLGLFSALQDDLGTIALFRAGLPSSPGVSLQMQTELLVKELPELKEVDIVNVVSKLGRTISFTKTYFNSVDTQETLAYATHVKYMPTGSRILDYIMSSSLFFVFYRLVVFFYPSTRTYEEKELFQGVIGANLEHHGIGQATFHVNMAEHANPSGVVHGGCSAMVMEQAAEAYVKAVLPNSGCTYSLKSMHLEYLSVVTGPSVEVECEELGSSDDDCLHVRVLVKKRGRVAVDGKLRFSIHRQSKL